MRKVMILCLLFCTLPLGWGYALEVQLPQSVGQGKCFSVLISSSKELTVAKSTFLGRDYSLFGIGDDYRAIIGVPPEQKPGVYTLSFTITDKDGKQETIAKNIKVAATKFPSTSFWLKPAKKKLLVKDLIAEEWSKVEKVLLIENAEQAWQGRFALPAKGPTSMVFGTIERINGKRSGQHRGFDIAVPTGSKIGAANSGKVVFAEKLQAFGGTIVIDHGQGVHTLYFHLSKFLAEVGQDVTQGDIIALSGNTGISSGPHLHWGMSVHNLRVDPAQWTKYAF